MKRILVLPGKIEHYEHSFVSIVLSRLRVGPAVIVAPEEVLRQTGTLKALIQSKGFWSGHRVPSLQNPLLRIKV